MTMSTKRLALVVVFTAAMSLWLAASGWQQPYFQSTGAPLLVRVEGGLIRGKAAKDVIAFKGIPFAQPPVGELRWRPPQPVVPWTGALEASEFKCNCVQLPTEGTSEDCLYANVWRPVSAANNPLPVLVWIHGGALVSGGASFYPLGFLARQGIVVVSFNYRLGRLGFFSHPALAAEDPKSPRGNYGYMDQIAALKWVKHNISAFGGDPNKVTIAGESAGGGSVLAMRTSPMARGLFHQAILQSAGLPAARAGPTPMRDLAASESIAVDYARSLGIEGNDKAALAALRALGAETLSTGTDAGKAVEATFGGAEIPGISHSIIDGQLIVEPPETALRAGRQAMVSVISGANSYDLGQSQAQSKDELFALFGPLAPHARACYDPKGEATLPALIQAAIADRTMIEPSRNLAESMTNAGQPAYFYRFSYVPECQRAFLPGAVHGAEIPYAFDAVSAVLQGMASEGDIAIGQTMAGYWAAFVKTGNPNGGGRPEWPRYNRATRDVLNFTSAGPTFGLDPLKARLDLWRSVWESGCAPREARVPRKE